MIGQGEPALTLKVVVQMHLVSVLALVEDGAHLGSALGARQSLITSDPMGALKCYFPAF